VIVYFLLKFYIAKRSLKNGCRHFSAITRRSLEEAFYRIHENISQSVKLKPIWFLQKSQRVRHHKFGRYW